MTNWTTWLFAVLLGVLVALTAVAAKHLTARADDYGTDMTDAVVKIKREGGHGSGVHIGNGRILTAAHVVSTDIDGGIVVQLENGYTVPAAVVWASEQYDIAVVSAAVIGKVGERRLNCNPLYIGQELQGTGNPADVAFVNVWGRVATKAKAYGQWPVLVSVDILGAQGMSGSAVYNRAGEIAGIIVAGYRVPFPLRSLMGVVPGDTVCQVVKSEGKLGQGPAPTGINLGNN